MYPGQYQNHPPPQNLGPPQIPQHPQQMIGGVQHVLVPQGWAPQPQPPPYYLAPPQQGTVQMVPTASYYSPSNPFAVQGMTYAQAPQGMVYTQQPVVQYVLQPVQNATSRLMELRRTASDGPGAFVIPQVPVQGLSNSVGSNYHQRYMRQFQNYQVQQQPPPPGAVYMIPQASPRAQPVLTASISPQPSQGSSSSLAASVSARPQTQPQPQPPAVSSSSSSSSFPYTPAQLPLPSSHKASAAVSPVPSQVLDEDPQPFLPPYEEILREGWLKFSASNDRYQPYWMILYKDFLCCLDTNSRPLWKITLWGTSVEAIPQTEGKRFAILSGYGQTFWFEGETSEEAAEWIKVLRTEVYTPLSRPSGAQRPPAAPSSPPTVAPPSQVASPKVAPSASLPVPTPASPSAIQNATSPSRRSQSGFFGFLSGLFTDTNDEELRQLCVAPPSSEQATKIRKKLSHNLSVSAHSLGRAVERFVAEFSKAHSDAEDEKQFAAAVAEVLAFIREMSNQIMTLYAFLSDIDSSDQICHEAVEIALTPKIYPLLSKMYQKRYRADDAAHSKKISEFLTVTPAHLGIRKLFWLLRTGSSSQVSKAGKPDSAADLMADETPPYYAAVKHLKQLPSLTSGHEKLACLIETGKIICQCVRQFWEGQVDPMKLVVGADDLVPIFTYVIIKANVPHLHADAAMMQDLMSEKAAMEVGGYSLATLQTCLQHITVMERQEVLKAAEDAAAQISERKDSATAISPAPSSSTPAPAAVTTPSPSSSSVAAKKTNIVEEEKPLAPTFSLEAIAAALAPPSEIKPAAVVVTPPTPETPVSSSSSSATAPSTASSTETPQQTTPTSTATFSTPTTAPVKSTPDLISFE